MKRLPSLLLLLCSLAPAASAFLVMHPDGCQHPREAPESIDRLFQEHTKTLAAD